MEDIPHTEGVEVGHQGEGDPVGGNQGVVVDVHILEEVLPALAAGTLEAAFAVVGHPVAIVPEALVGHLDLDLVV